ncbi:Hypothetical protein NTJ_07228 [Nesidiocoris tenuis]|uniref:Uncharacterized protein n=1 Tax=Nesidiocoris tenuis TaxID=355587 RepID=A0ABN7AQE1_9HEMI|nr:Hypothetical protein NTJ_07228 [Nesidiocoris tenuis]
MFVPRRRTGGSVRGPGRGGGPRGTGHLCRAPRITQNPGSGRCRCDSDWKAPSLPLARPAGPDVQVLWRSFDLAPPPPVPPAFIPPPPVLGFFPPSP